MIKIINSVCKKAHLTYHNTNGFALYLEFVFIDEPKLGVSFNITEKEQMNGILEILTINRKGFAKDQIWEGTIKQLVGRTARVAIDESTHKCTFNGFLL